MATPKRRSVRKGGSSKRIIDIEKITTGKFRWIVRPKRKGSRRKK